VTASRSNAGSTRVAAIAHRRFALQVSIGQGTRDKLEHAKALLGHQVPSGDLAEVLDRALDALIAKLEKRKLAATNRPQRARRPTCNRRTIPAHVRRAVSKRDGGRCTFVSESGTRCPAKAKLEYDHVTPVARGGEATIGNLRLRCRAHNQYEAERTFGEEFMRGKRAAARGSGATEQQATDANEEREATSRDATAPDADVAACLRTLGYRAAEVRRAVAHSRPAGSLEARVRMALSWFRPRGVYRESGEIGNCLRRAVQPG